MLVLSRKEHADIIQWMPDGKAFKILRPRAFQKEILPKYFKGAKYSSFKRKMSRWGFEPVKCDQESEKAETDWFGAEIFFHEKFQRGMVALVDEMSCKKAVPIHPNMRPVQKTGSAASGRAKRHSKGNTDSPVIPHAEAASSVEASRVLASHISSLRGPKPTDRPRVPIDSLNAAIDAEVARRFQEREAEIALNRNLRINALIQENLTGTNRLPLGTMPTGTVADLLTTGAPPTFPTMNAPTFPTMNSNINSLPLFGRVSQPSAASLLEQQRLRLRMLQQAQEAQEAQYAALLSTRNEGRGKSGKGGR